VAKALGKKMHTIKNRVLALALALVAPMVSIGDTSDVGGAFPIGFAFANPVQFPSAERDVTGFRLSIFYGANENVMGLDVGALVSIVEEDVFGIEVSGLVNSVGSSSGTLQVAGIANNCYDDFYGLQISGIANRVGGAVEGGQIGCFNLAGDMDGMQIGVYNKADVAAGLQIGVVNEAQSMTGVQIGLLNIIKNSSCPYLPIMNMCF
jgi:hypothetical protein